MKSTSCLFVLVLLIVAGQLLASYLATDDVVAGHLAGLLGWSIPSAGFLGLILFNTVRWRRDAAEPVVVEGR